MFSLPLVSSLLISQSPRRNDDIINGVNYVNLTLFLTTFAHLVGSPFWPNWPLSETMGRYIVSTLCSDAGAGFRRKRSEQRTDRPRQQRQQAHLKFNQRNISAERAVFPPVCWCCLGYPVLKPKWPIGG